MAGRSARTLTFAAMAVVSLSACTQQKLVQTQAELNTARECIVKQEAQSQLVTQQQATLIEQLQKVQTQLNVQQTILQERPQVVHMSTPKMDCPPPPPVKKSAANEQLLTDKQIVGLRTHNRQIVFERAQLRAIGFSTLLVSPKKRACH